MSEHSIMFKKCTFVVNFYAFFDCYAIHNGKWQTVSPTALEPLNRPERMSVKTFNL